MVNSAFLTGQHRSKLFKGLTQVSEQNNWFDVLFGLLAGHLFSRAIWGLLLWITQLGGHSARFGVGFVFLYGVAVVVAGMIWGIGYISVYALMPKAAKISGALSGWVGSYVALVLLGCNLFGWGGWLCRSIVWRGFLL